VAFGQGAGLAAGVAASVWVGRGATAWYVSPSVARFVAVANLIARFVAVANLIFRFVAVANLIVPG